MMKRRTGCYIAVGGRDDSEPRKGAMKHTIKEGSRNHVVWWDEEGTHCSEKDCEINTERNRRTKEKG